MSDIRQHGGLHEIVVGQRVTSAIEHNGRALPFRLVNLFEHPLLLAMIHHRPEIEAFLRARADLQS